MVFGATRRLPDCVCVLLRKYSRRSMLGSLRDQLRGGFHVAVRDAVAFLEERAELREQALDLARPRRAGRQR